NVRIFLALVLNGDDIADLHLKGRDVHLAVIHLNVAVIDQLACLAARRCKARTVNDVVQTAFEHEQKVLARNALLPQGLFEIIAKLFFEDKVNSLYFLLFTKLLAIAGKHLAAGRSVLSRGVGAALFDSAGGLETTVALQE